MLCELYLKAVKRKIGHFPTPSKQQNLKNRKIRPFIAQGKSRSFLEDGFLALEVEGKVNCNGLGLICCQNY